MPDYFDRPFHPVIPADVSLHALALLPGVYEEVYADGTEIGAEFGEEGELNYLARQIEITGVAGNLIYRLIGDEDVEITKAVEPGDVITRLFTHVDSDSTATGIRIIY